MKFTLHEPHRKERKRQIQIENFVIAKKLWKIKGTVPDRKSMQRDYQKNSKIKNLRCKLPKVNMKHNSFNPLFEDHYASKIIDSVD